MILSTRRRGIIECSGGAASPQSGDTEMPVHDWTRVGAGTVHHFHDAWIFELSERLNAGLLPDGCYALGEQHGGRVIADILTLHVGDAGPSLSPGGGAVAVAQAPPRVSRTIVASP